VTAASSVTPRLYDIESADRLVLTPSLLLLRRRFVRFQVQREAQALAPHQARLLSEGMDRLLRRKARV
jgi:hypothetical protein